MKAIISFFVLLVLFNSLHASPQSELEDAIRDASRLPQNQAFQTRYISLYSIPKEERDLHLKIVKFWLNSLSRESEFAIPRKVTDSLYAIEIDLYGWNTDTWEKLFEIEPYWHTKAKVQKHQQYGIYWRGGDYFGNGYLKPGKYYHEAKKEEIITISAPWIKAEDSLSLSTLTNSAVPIVRSDWWLFQTGDEVNRLVGYYDWLGIKNLKDAQTLAGFDLKLAQSARKEIAAIVTESGVGLNNRQIFRFGTISGAWWETRDPDKSVDKKNAVRNLDGDFDFDAMEVYYSLPNGLWGFLLLNKAGELQESAPDFIAADHASTNNDRRVRTGVSCVRCHAEGLRPIDDWSRKVFRNDVGLGSPDREKARRLKQLYLGPLQKELNRDRERYAEVLNDLIGMKPDELSKAFSKEWYRYESAPLLPAEIAREVGLTEKELIENIKAYLKSTGQIDLILASIVADPPVPIRREQYEEIFSLLMTKILNSEIKK